MNKQDLIDCAMVEIREAESSLQAGDMDAAEEHLKSALGFVQSQPDD
jgi:hypothetical protein